MQHVIDCIFRSAFAAVGMLAVTWLVSVVVRLLRYRRRGRRLAEIMRKDV